MNATIAGTRRLMAAVVVSAVVALAAPGVASAAERHDGPTWPTACDELQEPGPGTGPSDGWTAHHSGIRYLPLVR